MKKIYKINTKSWYIERLIFLIAGTLTIISTLLAYTIHINWLILAGVIGLMMIIFSLSGYCPAAIILNKLGFKGQKDIRN